MVKVKVIVKVKVKVNGKDKDKVKVKVKEKVKVKHKVFLKDSLQGAKRNCGFFYYCAPNGRSSAHLVSTSKWCEI